MTCSTSEVAVCCSSVSEVARPGLDLVEQPNVFDRDHRLIGESVDQLDLLVRKGLHFGALTARSRR